MSRAPVATVLPKPILKQPTPRASPSPCHSHQEKHAHFPPPAEEAKRYSGVEYDRTPITVVANELALPARGCPGRTFDALDAHHYRHHVKKASRPHGVFNGSGSNHMHPNYFAAAAATMNLPMELADSGAMPSLSMIHGDTSESDGDMSPPTSEMESAQSFLPKSVSMARDDQPRRLRKATANGQRDSNMHGHGNRLHQLVEFDPPSPSSTFTSCPGSNSCLGGF